MTEGPPPGVTLPRLAAYFLRLGATGFGGPVALANHMRRDLVETRGWLSESEYEDGMAVATVCPGPLAYQLGVYCGYVRFGARGALSVALAFALAPFLIVTVFAALYTDFSGSWVLRALFYGVAPVIVALILKASWQLGRKTLKADIVGWLMAAIAATVTALLQRELAVLFIGAGVLGSLWWSRGQAVPPAPKPTGTTGALLAVGGAGMQAPSAKLFLFFFKTAFLVFGSGLVIAPFLKAYVVDQYHWLDDRQFLDAVAVGMITPGPVVITATFVGYLLDGLLGAGAATAGIFSPSVILTMIAAPLLKRHRKNPYVQGFVKGVVAAVVGALLGTTVLVARHAIGDVFTAVAAIVALIVVVRWNKLPEPLIVLVAALAGLAAYPWLQPMWV
ncbi:MAG TPA: chromate efflux transporter [Gammaproteobacteria bacterium]|jgi:chromate transporter|nr:chromate efflux transporter [Gammaproteobacteria bacterium]